MNDHEKIKEALKGFNRSPISTMLGTVKTVDETEATASVEIDSELIIEDVRLRATVNDDKGFYVVPAVDSKVLIMRIEESDEFMIVGWSEFTKVFFKSENRTLEINDNEILFNGGALGSFMADLTKVVDKLNTIEGDINDLKGVFSNWTPAPQDGGAALKAASATWAGQQLTETTIDDVKDETIKN